MTKWEIREENCGGGFNIYSAETRIAHTSEVSQINATNGQPVTAAQAKENAETIVRSVNACPVLLAGMADAIAILSNTDIHSEERAHCALMHLGHLMTEVGVTPALDDDCSCGGGPLSGHAQECPHHA